MAESFAKYKKFDFSSSQEWRKYYDDLLPVPNYSQVEKFKRKWYKRAIDPSFDVDFKEDQGSSSTTSSEQAGNQQVPTATPHKNDQLYFIENLLKVIVFPGSFFLDSLYVKIMIAVASLLAVIRNKGMIKFSKDYLLLAVTSEFFHNIVFTVAMPHGRNSILFYLPIYIQFLSGICEYFSNQPQIAPHIQRFDFTKKLVTYVKQNRSFLIVQKNKLEIYLFFYTIFGCIFGVTSLINIFLMYQFLSIKDKMIPSMRTAQAEFKAQIVSIAPGPFKPIASKIVYYYEKLLNLMTPKQ